MFEKILKALLKMCKYSRNNHQRLRWPFSLTNSNRDFDFVGWVIKTSWLIYFRSVKFHYVKETHMMLVALVKIVVASQHKRQRKKSLSRFVEKWKLPDSDLKASARAALCKWATRTRQTCLSKTFANSPNKQKLSNRSWLWLTIVWETDKLTRYQPGVKRFLS